MVKDFPVIVHQAGKACIIHPERVHRGPYAVKQRIHAQHADQYIIFINGRHIGNRQQLAQEMGVIGTHPEGFSLSDGRKIPVGIRVFRVQLVRDQLGLLFKARLPHFGIEKAMFRRTDIRADAKIIGYDTV